MTTHTETAIDPTDGMPSRSALAMELILHRIRQFSETFYEEDRVEDIEFDYWDLGHDPEFKLGGVPPPESLAKTLPDLASLANGWWVWPELVGWAGVGGQEWRHADLCVHGRMAGMSSPTQQLSREADFCGKMLIVA